MILSTDPIADMLSRIRNAAMTKKTTLVLPYSKVKFTVLQVLAEAGWIERAAVQGQPPTTIEVTLKYDDQGKSVIRSLRRVSKPGRRVYVGHVDLPIVTNNFGVAIISTPKGMMTNREARKRNLGGEVICEVF